ncbi:complement receptor type 2-like [Cloeon dipterum]|uniref:complement receptor type 2-like n=1 Tax=Cloeon dipterum TaxID=197152 RepID=UPI00321F67EA
MSALHVFTLLSVAGAFASEIGFNGSAGDIFDISEQCSPIGMVLDETLQVRYVSDRMRNMVRFSCPHGFHLSGQEEAVCEYGRWNLDRLPTCTSYCYQPQGIENGGLDIGRAPVDGLGYANGTTVTYSCAPGYQFQPSGASGVRICSNGVWSGQAVTCVKKGGCVLEGTLVNGYSIEEREATHKVRYGCKSGYHLDGPPERKCLSGLWMPPFAPKCVKKPTQGVIAAADSSEETVETGRSCASTPVVPGATLVWVKGPMTTNGVTEGTELQFQCNEGLRDTEAPCELSKVRCINGKWHGRLPKCEEFQGCLPLPSIPHGALFGLAADGRYRVGARVAYTCQPGFRLRGNPVFSCETSGCWQPAMLPDCVADDQPFYLTGLTRGWEDYSLSPGAALLASLGTSLAVMAVLMVVCLAVICRRRRSRSGRSASGGRQRSSRLHHWPDDSPDAAPQPPPTLLPPDPDRVALIAFADGLQVGQSVLPSYEEATRERGGNLAPGGGIFFNALHRGRSGPQWTALSSGSGRRGRRHQHDRDTDTLSHHSLHGGICTRQSSSTSHSASLRSYAVDLTGSTDTMAATSDGSTTVTLDTVSSHGASSIASGSASCRAICGSLASFDTSSVLNTDGVPLLEESELEAAGERPEEAALEEAASGEPKQGTC